MKKNERMMLKAKKELEEVQKRQRARLLNLTDLNYIISLAKKEIEKLDKIEKKYFKGVKFCLNYGVAKAYKYPANTTQIAGIVNKYGNIQELNIGRVTAPKTVKG